ncbi:fluoride efflux transporter FluC [Bacillus sp. DJP31]|uniref:fluoride efflux transporter FluC n=1 Tax=Bacillus sp. DJP31 TaxID=3409789 RepID=UPI003BB7575E
MAGLKSLYISVGGFIGAGMRYGIGTLFPEIFSIAGTFIVNLLGCFLIGFVFHWLKNKGFKEELWLLLGTGLCGGFTTMSTLSSELVLLLQTGHHLIFGFYLIATWILGLVFTLVGINLATKSSAMRGAIDK